ncbi:hypothetical protein COO60DRAFT_1513748, partial [Scenedesmus sp. NREL 46B-D3]
QDAALAARNGDGHLHVRISQQSVPLSRTPHAHAYSCPLARMSQPAASPPGFLSLARLNCQAAGSRTAPPLLPLWLDRPAALLLLLQPPVLGAAHAHLAAWPEHLAPCSGAGSAAGVPLLCSGPVPTCRKPCPAGHSSRRLGGLLPCHTLHRGPAGAAAACHAGRCCGGQHRCRRWRFANPASH